MECEFPADSNLQCVYVPKTLSVQSIVHDELSIEDFMITQPKGAEALSDPPQPFAGGVRILWV